MQTSGKILGITVSVPGCNSSCCHVSLVACYGSRKRKLKKQLIIGRVQEKNCFRPTVCPLANFFFLKKAKL